MMKKKMKVLVVCVLIACFTLAGCKTKLSGSRWELSKAVTEEGTISREELEAQIGELEIIFADDTSFMMVGDGKSMKGTYSADGKKVSMILESGTQQSAEVNGDELTLLSTNGSGEVIMKKK